MSHCRLADLEKDVLQTALELEFPSDLAERQLETIANWGRYVELLAYDDEEFILEPETRR